MEYSVILLVITLYILLRARNIEVICLYRKYSDKVPCVNVCEGGDIIS